MGIRCLSDFELQFSVATAYRAFSDLFYYFVAITPSGMDCVKQTEPKIGSNARFRSRCKFAESNYRQMLEGYWNWLMRLGVPPWTIKLRQPRLRISCRFRRSIVYIAVAILTCGFRHCRHYCCRIIICNFAMHLKLHFIESGPIFTQ